VGMVMLMLMPTLARMIARLQAEHGSDEVSNKYTACCAVFICHFFLRVVFICHLLLVASVLYKNDKAS
jgi:hypothetical protein